MHYCKSCGIIYTNLDYVKNNNKRIRIDYKICFFHHSIPIYRLLFKEKRNRKEVDHLIKKLDLRATNYIDKGYCYCGIVLKDLTAQELLLVKEVFEI